MAVKDFINRAINRLRQVGGAISTGVKKVGQAIAKVPQAIQAPIQKQQALDQQRLATTRAVAPDVLATKTPSPLQNAIQRIQASRATPTPTPTANPAQTLVQRLQANKATKQIERVNTIKQDWSGKPKTNAITALRDALEEESLTGRIADVLEGRRGGLFKPEGQRGEFGAPVSEQLKPAVKVVGNLFESMLKRWTTAAKAPSTAEEAPVLPAGVEVKGLSVPGTTQKLFQRLVSTRPLTDLSDKEIEQLRATTDALKEQAKGFTKTAVDLAGVGAGAKLPSLGVADDALRASIPAWKKVALVSSSNAVENVGLILAEAGSEHRTVTPDEIIAAATLGAILPVLGLKLGEGKNIITKSVKESFEEGFRLEMQGIKSVGAGIDPFQEAGRNAAREAKAKLGAKGLPEGSSFTREAEKALKEGAEKLPVTNVKTFEEWMGGFKETPFGRNAEDGYATYLERQLGRVPTTEELKGIGKIKRLTTEPLDENVPAQKAIQRIQQTRQESPLYAEARKFAQEGKSTEEFLQAQQDKLPFMSDKMRSDYVRKPAEKISTNDLTPAKNSLLTEDNDFVYVKETPNYLVLTEKWTKGSRQGLIDKYGKSTNDVVMEQLTPRFKAVGEIDGLEMVSHKIQDGNSVVIYKKPQSSITSIYNEAVGKPEVKPSSFRPKEFNATQKPKIKPATEVQAGELTKSDIDIPEKYKGQFEYAKKYSTAQTKNEELLNTRIPLRYMGSKNQMFGYTADALGIMHRDFKNLRTWATRHLDDVERVYDVFGGSGATTSISKSLFRKATHYISDFDESLAKYYDQLAKHPDEVSEFLNRIHINEQVQKGFLPKSRFEDITAFLKANKAYQTAKLIYDTARDRIGQSVSPKKFEQILKAVKKSSEIFSNVNYSKADALEILDNLVKRGTDKDFVWIDPPYLMSTGYSKGKMFESHEGFMGLLNKLSELDRQKVKFVFYNADPEFVARREIAKIRDRRGRYAKLSKTEGEALINTIKNDLETELQRMSDLASGGMRVLRQLRPKGGAGGRTEIMITNSPWVNHTKTVESVEEKARELFRNGYITGSWNIDQIVQAIKHSIKENPENFLPAEVLDRLDPLIGKPINEMTTAELNTLLQNTKYLEKLVSVRGKIKVGDEFLELKDVSKQTVDELLPAKLKFKNLTNNPALNTDYNPYKKAIGLGLRERFSLFQQEAETIMHTIAGKDGTMQKILYDNIDRGVSRQYAFKREFVTWWEKQLADSKLDLRGWGRGTTVATKKLQFKQVVLGNGKTIALTPGDRISIYLHSLNNDNMAHMMEGGVRFPSSPGFELPTAVFKFSEDDVRKIISSMSKEEQQVAGWMRFYFNYMQKRGINDTSRSLLGYDLATTDNYFPIHTDMIDINQISSPRQDYVQNILENFGFLKPRTGAVTPLVLNDPFMVLYKAMNETSLYHGLAEPMRSARQFLNDKDIATQITNRFGRLYLEKLKSYLDNVEQKVKQVDNPLMDMLGSAFGGRGAKLARIFSVDNLRRRITQSILGLNIGTVLKQPISYLRAYAELPARYLNKYNRVMKVPNRIFEEMKEFEPQLWERLSTGHVSRDIGDIGVAAEMVEIMTGRHMFDIGSWGMQGISKTDANTLGRIWMATRDWVKTTTKLDPTSDEFKKEVASRAWKAIRRTQQAAHPKDISVVAGSTSPTFRLLTMFTTETNKTYNVVLRSHVEMMDTIRNLKPKTPGYWRRVSKARAKHMAVVSLSIIIPAILVTAIDEGRRRFRDKKAQSPIEIASNVVGNMLSNYYTLGDTWNAFINIVTKKPYGTTVGNVPVLGFVNDAVTAAGNLFTSILQFGSKEVYKSGDKRGEEKWITTMKKAADGVINTFAKLSGTPYYAPKEDIAGLFRLFGVIPRENSLTSESSSTGGAMKLGTTRAKGSSATSKARKVKR